MATKQPRARKAATEKTSSNLLEALKFISVAQHSEGTPMQTHCRIANGTITGFDGGITAGHLIEESLNVCPHTATLITALSKCKESISITQLDSGKLSIKSGKFRALVPCLDFEAIPAVEPDPPIAAITDAIKTALAACEPLAQDKADKAFMCAVLLQANTAVSTNLHVLIEAWHGLDLPPGILLPKVSAAAIYKASKPLVAFGFSANSATFYFEDQSFIKTQLYIDNFPNYASLLDVEVNPWPLPGGFYEAIDSISPFLTGGRVFFLENKMSSDSKGVDATTYDVDGLPSNLSFNTNYLKLIRPHVLTMQFDVGPKEMALFFGDGVRGALAKIG